METFKIEKGIQRPDRQYNGHRGHKYPFAKMEIGDSFLVPVPKGSKVFLFRTSLHSTAYSYALRAKVDWKFSTAIENNSIRIWRVK